MDIKDFIQKFEEQLDDVAPGTLDPQTRFRELEEWDSMTTLLIIAMIDKNYGKTISGDDIRKSETIGDLYDILNKE